MKKIITSSVNGASVMPSFLSIANGSGTIVRKSSGGVILSTGECLILNPRLAGPIYFPSPDGGGSVIAPSKF